jgi:putative transposase
MMLERGFEFTHEAVRSWEERYAPLITQHLRIRRKGRLGKSWYVDETYIKVKGSGVTSIGRWIERGDWLIVD